MATAFQSQLTSLIAEGAFDRFPGLRVVLAGSGFAWLPAWVWRFDKVWRGLRREVPWTTRLAVGDRAGPGPGDAAAGRRPGRPGGPAHGRSSSSGATSC